MCRAGLFSAAVTVCQPYMTIGPSASGRKLSRRARSNRSRRSTCSRVAPGFAVEPGRRGDCRDVIAFVRAVPSIQEGRGGEELRVP